MSFLRNILRISYNFFFSFNKHKILFTYFSLQFSVWLDISQIEEAYRRFVETHQVPYFC